MANKGQKNLIPLPERTEAEQRELRKKGGRASGKARREKSNLRKALLTVLSLDVPDDKIKKELKALGMETTMEQALALSVVKRAMDRGDYKALETIMTSVREHTREQDAKIKKLVAETEKIKEETARRSGKQGAEVAEKQAQAIADMINSPEAERALEDYLGAGE